MATQIDRATPDGDAFLDGLSDEDLALFAESLAIQRELEAEDGIVVEEPDPEPEPELAEEKKERVLVAAEAAPEPEAAEPGADVLPFRPRGRQPLSPAWRVLAAAAVVLVVVTPFLSRSAGGSAVREPSDAVAQLARRTLPDEYDDNRPFDPTRSDDGDKPTTEEGRAVRVGMYLVDLQLAIGERNEHATELMADRTAGLLQRAAGTAGPEAARAFKQISARAGGGPEPLLEELEAATDIAQEAVDRDYFALGAWAEAAIIAADQKDAAFFRSRPTRSTLRHAEQLMEDNAEARAALASIRAGLEPEQLNLSDIEMAVRALLGAIA